MQVLVNVKMLFFLRFKVFSPRLLRLRSAV